MTFFIYCLIAALIILAFIFIIASWIGKRIKKKNDFFEDFQKMPDEEKQKTLNNYYKTTGRKTVTGFISFSKKQWKHRKGILKMQNESRKINRQ